MNGEKIHVTAPLKQNEAPKGVSPLYPPSEWMHRNMVEAENRHSKVKSKEQWLQKMAISKAKSMPAPLKAPKQHQEGKAPVKAPLVAPLCGQMMGTPAKAQVKKEPVIKVPMMIAAKPPILAPVKAPVVLPKWPQQMETPLKVIREVTRADGKGERKGKGKGKGMMAEHQMAVKKEQEKGKMSQEKLNELLRIGNEKRMREKEGKEKVEEKVEDDWHMDILEGRVYEFDMNAAKKEEMEGIDDIEIDGMGEE